mmetsp:Transcript_83/g.140  ORF Transcript_83/g.140 Transcript_83/m.140 type:complete len:250 (+) Transcript_83:121-870(+)
MSGGWFDADWKYILRTQQFALALYPNGFASLATLEEFLARSFYSDQPHSEIQRVVKSMQTFTPYNRKLAEAGGQQSELVPAEMFAELIAYMLEKGDEPRLQKISIMMNVKDMQKKHAVSYEQFEQFANTCIPQDLEVATCRFYYRMLLKSHPDRLFPPMNLAMCISAMELEIILAQHSFTKELVLPGGSAVVDDLEEEVVSGNMGRMSRAASIAYSSTFSPRRGSTELHPDSKPRNENNLFSFASVQEI